MKAILTILFSLLLFTLSGQRELATYVDSEELYANITLRDGYTLYGLSKAIGVVPSDIVAANPGLDPNSMELKTTIRLPINGNVLLDTDMSMINPTEVKHRVQPKETLFSIAKRYAGKSVESILQLNGKSSTELSIGETLMLGFIDWPYDHSKPLLGDVEPQSDPIITVDTVAHYVSADTMYEVILEREGLVASDSAMINKTIKGIALMEQRSGGTQELVVLHREAAIDSEIQIYNPMMRRKVNAKVVAQLPDNSYPDDVSIVISPAVANALGALDRRFLVEMTYLASN